MKTFYVFKIKNNYISIALSNSTNLYLLLKSIYQYKNKDILVAFNLFNELCLPINIDFFNKYIYDRLKDDDLYTKFKNTHLYHDYFSGEESKMIIYKSHIRIKSNKDNNVFLCNLKDLTELFVCDFMNEYYRYYNGNKSSVIRNRVK